MTDAIASLGLVEDEDIVLDEAALRLAALDHPGLDLAPYLALLSALAERLAQLGDAPANTDRARLLAQVIATEEGFDGDRDSYDDPANADLIQVIDRRRGLPVSLAILYVAAARRLGWAADALNTPGHVVVRIGGAPDPVIVDPFRGGRALGRDALAAIVAGATGGARLAAAHLAPMSNRETLTRLLLNQASRAEAAGDAERARTLYARITAVAPASPHAWWRRARLELAAGRVRDARASLSGLLEMTREPGLRARVTELLERLAAS